MDLERDEFAISFDPAVVSKQKLLLASKAAGFPARLVSDSSEAEDPPFFREDLARARREGKPIVVDFTASWCAPCQRMLRETFPDPQVARLLAQCVFVKVDTDEYPALAQRFGAVALPDVRLLDSEGRELRRVRDYQSPDAFAEVLRELLESNRRPGGGDKTAELIVTSPDDSEIKEAFNRDVGFVRLLVVLSPT